VKKLIICSAVALTNIFGAAAELIFKEQSFQLPRNVEGITATDFNGDDSAELIIEFASSLRIFFANNTQYDFEKNFFEIPVLSENQQSAAWDISHDADNNPAIVILNSKGQLNCWAFNGTRFNEELILTSEPPTIPRGLNKLNFVIDANGDEYNDYAIPQFGGIGIFISNPQEQFTDPISVNSAIEVNTLLYSNNPLRDLGQKIKIPELQLRDVNADNELDLIIDTKDRLEVYIFDSSRKTFRSIPSYFIDRNEIEDRLGEFDIENVDFSNLTGVLALTHEEILEDINGDGIEDLLLREAGKVSIFEGFSKGLKLDTPIQILRSGGNVLATFLYDENNDGYKDLWLWRVEPISVGDIFVWLALSGSINLEAFVYRNQNGNFARRPARKVTVSLKFPPVTRLASSFSQARESIRNTADRYTEQTLRINRNSNQFTDDLAHYTGEKINIFFNNLEKENRDADFLSSVGYTPERDSYEIDLRSVIDGIKNQKDPLLKNTLGKKADIVVQLDSFWQNAKIFALRLNSDSNDDFILLNAVSDQWIDGILLLSVE
jgi:hypothetical protein